MARLANCHFGRITSTKLIVFLVATACLFPATVMAEVMGAKKSKVYHTHPDRCGAAKNIADGNRVTFKSVEEAKGEGRRLCKTCARLDEKLKEEGSKKKEAKTPPETGRKSEPKQDDPKHGDSEPRDKPGVPGDESRPLPPARIKIVKVKRVLPGATLELDNGERIYLAGIGAPIRGQPIADELDRQLEKLTKGRKVTIAWLSAGESVRDRYGRLAAFASAGSSREDLGGRLIEDGLAWVDRSANFELLSEYLRLEDDAAWDQRGVWKRLKGAGGAASVVVGKFTREYHSPDCPHASLLIEPTTISVNEAKGRRLTPCEFWRPE